MGPISPNKSINPDIHYPNKKRRLCKDKCKKQRHKKAKPKLKSYSTLNQLIVGGTESVNIPNKNKKDRKKENKSSKPKPKAPVVNMQKCKRRRKVKSKACYSSLSAL